MPQLVRSDTAPGESCTLPGPYGPMLVTWQGTAVTGLRPLVNAAELTARSAAGPGSWDAGGICAHPVVDRVARQLKEYFAGRRQQFELELQLQGTPFQQMVWQELCRIPFGNTIGYTELAARIGRPRAVRAVGQANAANPIWLIVPCHRVIGCRGQLTGYAFGVSMKEQLLKFETSVTDDSGRR